jgi:phage head maturation protease
MRVYLPIAKVNAENREVWGYASTEARDDQGEIIRRDALVAALGDYMRFANIREMHQLSAVGVAREAAVDDRGLYVGAKIVDDQAWQKVVEGVYKGYSIGGRVTQRDPADYKTITGLVLNEISLVDRPANPEAVFDYWKASGAARMPETRFNPPFQVWACGVPEHRHVAKAEALRCQDQLASSGAGLIAAARNAISNIEDALEKSEGEREAEPDAAGNSVAYADPGYQADGKKRYPIDSEKHIRAAWNFINRPSNATRYTAAQLDQVRTRIVAAWKARIDAAGPPSADGQDAEPPTARVGLTKTLWDVGRVARIILDLNWLKESLAIEAAMEADDSPQPARLQAIIVELCDFLSALIAEEAGEILDDVEEVGETEAGGAEAMMSAGGARDAALVAELRRAQDPKMRKFGAAVLAKSKHSDWDQALLDLAYHAVDKCSGMDGLLFAEKRHLAQARDALKAAGATASTEVAVDTARSPMLRSPMVRPREAELDPIENSTINTSKHPHAGVGSGILEMIEMALGKRSQSHQALMDVAHDCIGKLMDGNCCRAVKAGARHSRETLGHLAKAHDHLIAAGAKCDAVRLGSEEAGEGSGFESRKTAAASLAKIITDERSEKAALIATLADIVPRLDQLTKRVEDIARTPLPPLTIAKGVTAISKQQDVGNAALSPDDLAAAFSRMNQEEQTLTLIKASYARPIRPPGLTPARETQGS